MSTENGVSADMMTAQDAAAFLGISQRQFRRVRAQEKLVGKVVDGEVRFSRTAVEAIADDPDDESASLGHLERVLTIALRAVQQQSEAAAAQTESMRKLHEQMSADLQSARKDAIEGIGVLREKILDDAKREAEKMRDASNLKMREDFVRSVQPLVPRVVGAAMQKLGAPIPKEDVAEETILAVASNLTQERLAPLEEQLSADEMALLLTLASVAHARRIQPEVLKDLRALAPEKLAIISGILTPKEQAALAPFVVVEQKDGKP